MISPLGSCNEAPQTIQEYVSVYKMAVIWITAGSDGLRKRVVSGQWLVVSWRE
jgi:hypothetical protein